MSKEYTTISTPVFGEVVIKENSQYNDIKADKVIIEAKVTARLFGSVKDIVLKKDSLLYMHGRILGNVTNEGGEINIFPVGTK